MSDSLYGFLKDYKAIFIPFALFTFIAQLCQALSLLLLANFLSTEFGFAAVQFPSILAFVEQFDLPEITILFTFSILILTAANYFSGYNINKAVLNIRLQFFNSIFQSKKMSASNVTERTNFFYVWNVESAKLVASFNDAANVLSGCLSIFAFLGLWVISDPAILKTILIIFLILASIVFLLTILFQIAQRKWAQYNNRLDHLISTDMSSVLEFDELISGADLVSEMGVSFHENLRIKFRAAMRMHFIVCLQRASKPVAVILSMYLLSYYLDIASIGIGGYGLVVCYKCYTSLNAIQSAWLSLRRSLPMADNLRAVRESLSEQQECIGLNEFQKLLLRSVEINQIGLRQTGLFIIKGESGKGKSVFLQFYVNQLRRDDVSVVLCPTYSPRLKGSMAGYETHQVSLIRSIFNKIDPARFSYYSKEFKIDPCLHNISDLDLSKIRSFSTGSLRKLFIAICLSVDSDFYVFDEPFASLDELSREKICDALVALGGQKTVLVVDHSFPRNFLERATYLN